jgi:hypothetical protein
MRTLRRLGTVALLFVCACSSSSGNATSGASAQVSAKDASSAAAQASDKTAHKADDESPKKKDHVYDTVFYPSGTLKIEAYTYRPEGDGPFPAIIYNHGSRTKETSEATFAYVSKMLAEHGYYVIVPERRGYGKSDGEAPSEAKQEGETLVPRMQDEVKDVLAAMDYLKTVKDRRYETRRSHGLVARRHHGRLRALQKPRFQGRSKPSRILTQLEKVGGHS